ncbi:MAG: hypothetical protein ABSH49_03045 [Bryobacteraceae bacterium]
MPNGFSNRDRIGGISLRAKYSGVVLWRISEKWDMAGSMAVLGPRFQELSRRFAVVESTITFIESLDTEGYGWWGKARVPNGSGREEIGFFFPMDGNAPPGLSAFNSQIDGLISRVQSIPWLSRYLAAHRSAHVELRFVNDRSLSVRARDSLLEDLRKNDKRSVAERVAAERGGSMLLEIEDDPGSWSRWISFTNGDMLLWHFQGKKALGYPTTTRRTWDYYGWKGVALLVRPDGAVSE